jgi:hypothetical protein
MRQQSLEAVFVTVVGQVKLVTPSAVETLRMDLCAWQHVLPDTPAARLLCYVHFLPGPLHPAVHIYSAPCPVKLDICSDMALRLLGARAALFVPAAILEPPRTSRARMMQRGL